MLIAGQSAGNILHTYFPFISAKRARKGILQLSATVEVKRLNRNQQPPHWPNEVPSALHGLKKTLEIKR